MNFPKRIENDILILTFKVERTTFKEYEELKQTVQPELDKGIKKVIVDMHDCSFIDSTILGLLINFLKQTDQNLKMVDVHGDVQTILDITRTATLFNNYSSIEEAAANFSLVGS